MYPTETQSIHSYTVCVACVPFAFSDIDIYTRDELTPNKERRMRLVYALVAVAEISSIWYLFTDLWIFLDQTSLILKTRIVLFKRVSN